MVCLELKCGVVGWKVQTNQLNYCGTPKGGGLVGFDFSFYQNSLSMNLLLLSKALLKLKALFVESNWAHS